MVMVNFRTGESHTLMDLLEWATDDAAGDPPVQAEYRRLWKKVEAAVYNKDVRVKDRKRRRQLVDAEMEAWKTREHTVA